MSIKQWLYRNNVFLLYHYRKGGDVSQSEDLLSALNKSSQEIENINFARFQQIFTHAYNNSVFYHEKYQKAGITPDDIRSKEDIEKIPILTRDEVKENRERILCNGVSRKKVYLSSTGGSTGSPLFFYHEEAEPYVFLKWRMYKMLGIPFASNGAMIIRRNNTLVNRLKNGVWNWPAKVIFLNAKMITKDSIKSFIKDAKEYNVKYLWGYEGGLYYLATFLRENNMSIPSISCVISTSSPLPESHRFFFKEVFKCDIYDQYGSCEIQWLGVECPKHHGLHIPWDVRRIEFVDQNGKNVPIKEYGDIIVTDLINYSFPFIRYKNGDRGRLLSNSGCMIPFPVMDSVKGRITDTIVFPDGSCVTGEYLTTLFDDYPMVVKAFQVVQKRDYSIELQYVPSDNKDSDLQIKSVIKQLSEVVGDRAKVCGVEKTNISHDGGKTRYVISEIRK